MHTEAMPRQFKIIASKDELKLIIVALNFSAGVNNPIWESATKQQVKYLADSISATLKQE